jgi:hypothetical protein
MFSTLLDLLIGFSFLALCNYAIYYNNLLVAFLSAFFLFIYIISLPPYRSVILACSLGAFNGAHYLFFPKINVSNEPYLFKAVKDIVFVGLIVNLLIKNKKRRTYNMKTLFLKTWPLLLFILYIFLYIMVSIPFQNKRAMSFVNLRYLVAYPMLLYLGIGVFINAEEKNLLFSTLVLVSVIVAVLGVWEVFTKYPSYFYGEIKFANIEQRMISTLINPNNCAYYLMIPLIYLSGNYKEEHSYILRISCFLIISFGLTLTFSRSGFVGLSMGLLVVAILSKEIITKFIVSVCTVFGLAMVVITTIIRETAYKNVYPTGFEKYFQRLIFAKEQVGSVIQGPDLMNAITGIGFGGDIYVTDNMFAHIFVGGGIIALILFIVLIGCLLKLFLDICLKSEMLSRKYNVCNFAMLVALTINMFSAVVLLLYPTALMFWVFCSIMLTSKEISFQNIERFSISTHK